MDVADLNDPKPIEIRRQLFKLNFGFPSREPEKSVKHSEHETDNGHDKNSVRSCRRAKRKMNEKRRQVANHRRDPEKTQKSHRPESNPLHQHFVPDDVIAFLLPKHERQPENGGERQN